MLDTNANGPKLLVQLPAGHYQILAIHDGQTVRRSLVVADKRMEQVVIGFKG